MTDLERVAEAISREQCKHLRIDPDEMVLAGDPIGNPAEYPQWMLGLPWARQIAQAAIAVWNDRPGAGEQFAENAKTSQPLHGATVEATGAAAAETIERVEVVAEAIWDTWRAQRLDADVRDTTWAQLVWAAQDNPTIAAEVRLGRDEALAAIRALGAEGKDGWEPIETAPKDGTPILGVRGGKDVGQVVVMRTRPQWPGFYSIPGDYAAHPTHWRPLPTAPGDAGK